MPTDRREFGKIFALLTAVYPRRELAPGTMAAYHELLHDLDPDLLKMATLHLASSSKWFPAASEIRDTVFGFGERANGVPDAGQAWEAVIREFGRAGNWGKPDFGHPLIDRTVRAIGGWRNICLSTNQVADRARFIEAFDRTVQRERAEVRMLPEVRAAAARLMAPRQQALSAGPGAGDVGGDLVVGSLERGGDGDDGDDQAGPGEVGSDGDDHQARPGSQECADLVGAPDQDQG